MTDPKMKEMIVSQKFQNQITVLRELQKFQENTNSLKFYQKK
jgi:hypothetical protein